MIKNWVITYKYADSTFQIRKSSGMTSDWKLVAWEDFSWMLEVTEYYSDSARLRSWKNRSYSEWRTDNHEHSFEELAHML